MYYQLLFIIAITHAQYNNTQCNLTQIASEFDCLHYKDGSTYWNNTICSKNTTSTDTGTVEVDTTPTYCSLIATNECAADENCALVQGQCTHFSGCAPFTSDEDCQSISDRCVSDGKQCVEILQCTDFLTETACQYDQNGDYCYWDGTVCVLADDCNKLPPNLINDEQCRAELQKCTVSSNGKGCTPSGITCSDQLIQTQCKWNQYQTQECYWNGTKCVDKKCENAPLTFSTDKQCIEFIPKCTTKLDGGCILRSTCSAATNEAACQTDSSGNDCYWNDVKCVDLLCENAPNTFDTNLECKDFLSECITTGKGCVKNQYCSSAIIESACVQDPQNKKCVWSNGSCQNIACNLAPITLTTNTDCSSFMQGCVTKKSGGCIALTDCKNYDIEEACIINAIGNECYWNNQCIDRTCANAPNTFKTHEECYNYSVDCTVNQNGSGCVNQTCENTLTKELCVDDYQGRLCTYFDKCYPKECSFANYKTALECYNYLNECTLDNSGSGCVQLPPTCQGNLIQAACYYKVDGECGWNPTTKTCVDKSCLTADSAYNTNQLCDQYLSGCVVSNSSGCMVLPDKCDQRLKEENCEFEGDTCVWGNNLCQERSCQTAQFEIDQFTAKTCKQYINCYSDVKKCCIMNNTGTSCMAKSTCADLAESNCTSASSIKGDCFWNGESCKDKGELTCSDLIAFTTHEECQTQLDTCTIDSDQIGCVDLSSTCEEYTQQQCHIISDGSVCVWKNNKCNSFQDEYCTSAPDSTDYSTDSQCQTYQIGCTVTPDIGGCVDQFTDCSLYLKKESCYKTKSSSVKNCYWYNNVCKTVNSCTDINFLTSYTTANCSSILSNCKANPLSNGCIAKICTDYAYTTLKQCQAIGCSINKAQTQCVVLSTYCSGYSEADCYYAKNQSCFYYSYGGNCSPTKVICENLIGDNNSCPSYKPSCKGSSNGGASCETKICGSKQLSTFIPIEAYQICQAFDLSCSTCANIDQCVNMYDESFCIEKRFCSSYSRDECFYGTDGYCTKLMYNNVYQGCKSITTLSYCNEIKIDYYYPGLCDQFVVGIGCTTSTVQGELCTDRTCDNKPTGTGYTQEICSDWLEGCTSNMDGTKCVEMLNNCSDYQGTNCPQSVSSGFCQVVNNQCVPRSCSQASNTIVSNDQCLTFMNTCAVAKIGGCVKRQDQCSDITLQKQCYFDFYGNRCFWNPTDKKCVELTCANIEQSVAFSKNEQCQAIEHVDCIIRSSGQGCQDNTKSCSTFTAEIQCTEDEYGQECEWLSNNTCVIKNCSTAPSTLTTLKQCVQYYTITKCTTKSNGGCTDQQDTCEKYKDQGSCIITTELIDCGWNETAQQCQIKSCETAPLSYNSQSLCYSYMNICNVATSGNGCVTNPSSCEEMTEIQCGSSDCYYDTNSCITRTCDNIPSDNSDCTGYLSTCQSDNIKCKTAICEYYEYTTDDQCKSIMSDCTTDGYKCVPRNTCAQITHQNGCITQSDGQQCQWLSTGLCVVKRCSTAPTTINSHYGCQNYYPNCTSKVGGGCQSYTVCTSYTMSDQCVIDSSGIDCVWDTTQCRYKQCIDFTGTDHSSCQKQSSQCTANLSTKHCMNFEECSQYTSKQTCIIGTDGICLWIIDKCYQYSQCEDIAFTTHDECQAVSDDCTTNGITCVPLTYCEKTNTNGGCILGIDGDCVEIVKDNVKSCALFETCKQLSYLTHSLCYQAQINCTTDGITGCIYLSSCNSYTYQDSCYINDVGKVISNTQVQSTGKCVWSSNACRDENCTDLTGTTSIACEAQLYECTSDGSKCISKVKCTDHIRQETCNVAKSDEAYCFWDTKKAACRTIQCSDITNPTSISYCKDKNQTCTYDGSVCISVALCAEYTTAQACNSKGSDGSLCAWIPPPATEYVATQSQRNVCFKMTECKSGSYDKDSCLQASDKCYYQSATDTSASSCSEHTCQTYYSQNKKCQYFYNWDETIITPCQLDSKNQCSVLKDPQTLNSTSCYLLSGYTYSYNSSTNTCITCGIQRSNKTHNTIHSIILGVLVLILLS